MIQVLRKNQTRFLFKNNLFKLCNKGDIDFNIPPKQKIIDATCLSEKTKTDTIFDFNASF